MILTTNILFLLATLFSGAYKKWESCYQTILFLSFCNLLYNLLCQDRLLWEYHPYYLLNHTITDLVNTFVLLPCTVTLYTHFFPANNLSKAIYYLGWVIGYSFI